MLAVVLPNFAISLIGFFGGESHVSPYCLRLVWSSKSLIIIISETKFCEFYYLLSEYLPIPMQNKIAFSTLKIWENSLIITGNGQIPMTKIYFMRIG